MAQHKYTIGSFKKTFKHYEYETMMINIDRMLAEFLFLIFCYGQFKNTGIHSEYLRVSTLELTYCTIFRTNGTLKIKPQQLV